MRKNLLSLFLLLSCFSLAFAQNKTVTGKVTDSKDGSTLPGVSVSAKGTPSIGTQTNADGGFSLSVPAGTKTIVFKYIG